MEIYFNFKNAFITFLSIWQLRSWLKGHNPSLSSTDKLSNNKPNGENTTKLCYIRPMNAMILKATAVSRDDKL